MTDPRATVVLDGEVGPLRQKLREGLQEVDRFGQQARSAGDGASTAFSGFTSALGGLAAVLSVGAMTAFIREQIDFEDHMDESAQKIGISTQALSEWTYVAKMSSLETDDMVKVMAKLSSTLADAKSGQKDAVELFQRLKLDPNNIKDADEALMLISGRFGHMEDGIDKTGLAIDAFGEKIGPRMLPLVNAGAEGIAQLRKEANELGVTVADKAGAEAAKLNDNLDRLAAHSKGAAMALANELIPYLAKLVEWLVEANKQGGIFSTTIERMKQNWLHFTIGDDLERANTQMRVMVGRANVLVNEIERLSKMDPNEMLGATVGPDGHGAMAAVDRIKQLRAEYEMLQKDIAKMGEIRGYMFPPPPSTYNTTIAGYGRGFINRTSEIDDTFVPGKKAPTPGPAPKSQMPELEERLANEQQFLALAGETRLINKQQELAYWQSVLQYAKLSTDDRIAVSRKASQLDVEIHKEAAQRKDQIDANSVQGWQDLQLARIEGQRAAARALLNNNELTKTQELQLEMRFETERYNVQMAALQQRQALLEQDPTQNAVELAKVKDQMLIIEQQYHAQRLQISGQMAQDSGLTDVFQNAASSAGTALDSMLSKTQTWAQALSSVYASVRSQFISMMITEPLKAWAASQARMLAMKLGFSMQETGINEASAAKNVGIKGAEATGVATANAVEAGSGAASAMASIPYVGPVLAVAAMAAIFAAVMGLSSKVKSARGGFDIPRGVNPLTQLHEEEMVLPKGPSNVIRKLADSGLPDGQPASGDMTVHYNDYSGRLSDADIQRNATKLANALNKAHRNGWRPARA